MYFLWIIILIEITMGRCQYNNTSIIERTSNEIKCPVQTLIKIESATFSPILSNCPYCQNKNFKNCSQNITEMVQNVCDGKANCVVQSTTDLYGDPCTGFTKYANIFYLCKPEGAWSSWGNWSVCSAAYGFGLINRSRDCNMSYNALPWCSGNKNEVKDCFVNITNAALIIEWSSKEIICPVQTLIKIEDATFSPVLTNCAYCQNKNVKNCSQNITGIIQKKCDRNNYCVIQSNVDLYGDPCLGFTKYTNVLYFCFSEDFSEELWNVSNIVKLNGYLLKMNLQIYAVIKSLLNVYLEFEYFFPPFITFTAESVIQSFVRTNSNRMQYYFNGSINSFKSFSYSFNASIVCSKCPLPGLFILDIPLKVTTQVEAGSRITLFKTFRNAVECFSSLKIPIVADVLNESYGRGIYWNAEKSCIYVCMNQHVPSAKVACFFSSDESSLWSELDLRIGSVLGHHSITKELYAIHRNQKTFMMFHNIHKRWLSLTNQQFYESASNYIDPTMRKSFEAEYDQTYILGPNQWLGNAQGLFSRKSNNEPWVPRIKWHF
ncbi:uncharacterized protein LOC105850306 isoform X2 [Hydra vulgaris]|uniref:Uncharacterized protein LOC105850306 isoform X2 n=1 Tax=Hydra vulgaris TaxID=6087 RepID=A0ABM4DGA4_HYDVU